MIKYDCHVHTSFSSDSKAAPEDQIEQAIANGLKGICITDHMDYEFPEIERSGLDFLFCPDGYFNKLRELKDKYRDSIDLLIGIELGLRNEKGCGERTCNDYHRLLEAYPFDFVIGSTHCLEFTDPYYPSPYWDDKSAQDGIRTYFEAILQNIASFEEIDTLGHIDYLVRYVPEVRRDNGRLGINDIYDPKDYFDITDEIYRILIERGISLEINTAGLKYGLGYSHPHTCLLRRYREFGGEMITVGSDGHKPEHICYGFDETCDMLTSLGFKYQCVYRGRKPEMLPLE